MAELNDELLNQVTWKIANALVLIGSRSGDEWNAMTASWVTQVSMEPVLIGVGIDNKSVTHRLIAPGGVFSVNLWPADDTRIFVKFSKPAEQGRRHPQRAPDHHRHDRSAGLRRGAGVDGL